MIASSGHAMLAPPTRVRYQVVALAVLLAMVTYLDRVCISKLAPDIMRDLRLSKIQMGYVFSAFALAYATLRDPHRLVGRSRAARGWCSPASSCGGRVHHRDRARPSTTPTMLLVRFLFGAGEAGAWPCVARTFSRWIPRRERGTVQGIFFAGAHLVGGLTPLADRRAAAVLALARDLRVFGLVGLVWATAWYDGSATIRPSIPRSTRRSCAHIVADVRPTVRTRRAGRIGAAAARPQRGGAVRDVLVEQHDLLLLHHLAADLSEQASRLRRDGAGFSLRAAAPGQRAERSVRRRRDRPAGGALRAAGRPLLRRRGGLRDLRRVAVPGAAVGQLADRRGDR